MKGQIVTQQVYDSILDFTHGFSHTVKRILVPDADNLVITPHEGEVYAWTGGLEGEYEVIGEVDVPDELVVRALAFARAKKEFDSLVKRFEGLIH
jgi:hypothetical protein